jgi:hypothetical protein
VSPVKYELGVYIPEDDILHSHRSGNLSSYSELRLSEYITHCRSLIHRTMEIRDGTGRFRLV